MKYQFQSNPGEFSYRPTLFPNAIKILVSVNFGIFLLQEISKSQKLFFETLFLTERVRQQKFLTEKNVGKDTETESDLIW